MTVEILFGEVCNLYGDGQNPAYLRATLPDEEFIYTALTDEPYFKDRDPDILYIGSMSENTQRRVIAKLLPLKDRLKELINKGTVILATGNAAEIFAKHISYVTEEIETDGLGFVDLTVKTDLFDRYNGKIIGSADGVTVTGFRSQFGFLYGDNSKNYFLEVERGDGICRGSRHEGFRINNFIGTQILGPVLPLNPAFTEYLIRLAGKEVRAAFREDAVKAYEQRVKEFRDPATVFGNNH